jgi:putative SOS response-associated peptidase YedK
MCGRVALPEAAAIVNELKLKYDGSDQPANINVSPTMQVPLMTASKPDRLQYFIWSVIPPFSRTGSPDFKLSTFNAMSERLEESGLWQPLLGKKHCVLITEGFYEWQYADPVKKKNSTPHLIKARNSRFTFMAGLWELWTNPATGELVPSCAVITLPANSLMAEIHNTKGRMPAFLTADSLKIWLDQGLSFSERKKVLEQVPDEFLETYPIKKVGDEEEYKALISVC